jgi:hypothetical protein
VPMLVSADVEGSRMSLAGGTEFPNPLSLAAIDDMATTSAISRAMAIEALAAGINWSFTPVLDINAKFKSAIVATRGFGSDLGTIERHALAALTAFQENGVAVAIKHWPGEGYDDRDQHLVTTVNPLSIAEWEASFGRLYRAAIAAGAMSVMSAHISFPAFIRPESGCGRRGLSAGLDQQRAQQHAAARAARLQWTHRFGRDGDGRSQGMVKPGRLSAAAHRQWLRCDFVRGQCGGRSWIHHRCAGRRPTEPGADR